MFITVLLRVRCSCYHEGESRGHSEVPEEDDEERQADANGDGSLRISSLFPTADEEKYISLESSKHCPNVYLVAIVSNPTYP